MQRLTREALHQIDRQNPIPSGSRNSHTPTHIEKQTLLGIATSGGRSPKVMGLLGSILRSQK